MRLYGRGSISTPAKVVLDALLVIAGLSIVAQAVLVAILLVNPLHPLRKRYQVTTIVSVPARMWPPEGVVRLDSGIATIRVDPWAYLTYQPASRSFVAVTAVVSYSWWACAVLALLQFRRAFTNLAAGTPFPRDNIRRIRVAGWAILGTAAIDLIIDAAMFGLMRLTTTVAGGPAVVPWDILVVDFPLATVLAGLAVVILAEIFRAGADLQDDQALTV
jgi:hypothetical protein